MRIFLACHSYFEKCKVRCPLLIPLPRLMLSCEKTADDGHFYKSMRRCENPAEKPICTHETVHPPFLPRRGVLIFPFPPNLYLLMGTGAELACEYTLCTAEGELKLLCGPHTQMLHRVSQDAGSSNTPHRVPSGHPCRGCALLLRPLLGFTHSCSWRFLQMCLAYTGV